MSAVVPETFAGPGQTSFQELKVGLEIRNHSGLLLRLGLTVEVSVL